MELQVELAVAKGDTRPLLGSRLLLAQLSQPLASPYSLGPRAHQHHQANTGLKRDNHFYLDF